MPLDLQNGSPGEAVRKGFGIRGSISMLVDETIVPVTSVRQLDQPPYRTDGVACNVGASQAASVGNFSSIHFQSEANIVSEYQVLIDWLIISNPNAVLATFITGLRGAILGATRVAQTTEYVARGPNLTDLLSPTLLDVGITQSAGSAVGTRQSEVALAAGGSIAIPINQLLRPTMALVVETSIVNQAISAMAIGRVWQG